MFSLINFVRKYAILNLSELIFSLNKNNELLKRMMTQRIEKDYSSMEIDLNESYSDSSSDE